MSVATLPVPPAGERRVAGLARALVVLVFGLIVLGAVVRSTGSGLACPDWPLCHGRILPPLQAQALLEWFHRLIALVAGLGSLALAVGIARSRSLRGELARLMAAGLVLFVVQALLGALTVWKLLAFSIVTLHLGNALLFLAVLIAIAERLERRADPVAVVPVAGERARAGRRAATWLAIGSTGALLQILLGGLVSTNHAGLACPDFPACNGELFPPLAGLVGLQMAHRYGAYALCALLVAAWWQARRSPDPRVGAGATAALALLAVQIVLGVFNVLLAVPVWLTAAHLATATAIFALLALATARAYAAAGPAEAGLEPGTRA